MSKGLKDYNDFRIQLKLFVMSVFKVKLILFQSNYQVLKASLERAQNYKFITQNSYY